jgi:DNA-binding winged helix-turn-helix (wHTH) protein
VIEEKAPCFEFDDVRVEPRAFKIWKAGREVSLEPKAFKLLLFLMENRGRLVEKGELLDAVWKDTFVTENALTREIAKLRKMLGDDPRHARPGDAGGRVKGALDRAVGERLAGRVSLARLC